MTPDRTEFEVVFDHWRANVIPIVCKSSVALNERAGLDKLLAKLSPRKTRSVNMSHVDHCQSLIGQHQSFHRLLQREVIQNEANQRRRIFRIRIHEIS